MKNKTWLAVVALATALFVSGCISATIVQLAGRGRKVLESGTREQISNHFGAPLADPPEVAVAHAKRIAEGKPWTVWKVRGRPAHSANNGQAQAMIGAMSLGLSELIVLPYTVVTETEKAFQDFYLFCAFGSDGKIVRHGYIPVPEPEAARKP